jgi:serine/threonine protein kinase
MEQVAAADQSLTFLQPSDDPEALGRLDDYEVLEVVGWGGTGVVLKARDTKRQTVALKVLAPRLAASRTARQRFVGEAQAAAAVCDEHVVAIHAVCDAGPVPYLVMEYVQGITLEQRIRQAGALEIGEVLRIGAQLARGLAAAHAQSVIHRDIKPSNVLLQTQASQPPDWVVKITDFGLAGVAERGVIAGTPLFMSPEQARGRPTDARSDLFSLGSVLYALCTGRPPFQGDSTADVLRSVCEDAPRPVREINADVPGWLGDLIDRLLAKEAGDRFTSAQEVADLLSTAPGCGTVS